uniref:Amino acid transporter n=1 Tax=Mesocestoides corti TaxID=53468 RepID=A0A5K3ES61_MESCO
MADSDKSTIDVSLHGEKEKRGFVLFLRENLFVLLILVGVAVGFGIGFGGKYLPNPEVSRLWIQMPGDIYLHLLQLTVLPLIAANLIIVIASIDPREQGRNSLLCLVWILAYNVCGAAIGTALSAVINPGSRMKDSNTSSLTGLTGLEPTTSDVFSNLLLNLFPENIVAMTIFQTATEYEIDNSTGIPVKVRKQVFNHATNMIGVLYTCIFFGLAARVAGERGLQFLNFFRSLADVVLVLIRWFLLLTPVGVCFMIAGSVVKIDNISHTFAELGFFVVTVLAGSLIDIVLSFAIFVVITRRNPFSFFKHTIKASLVAFATTSPIVSIPEMYEGCDRYGIDTKISRIACPLASALKADGPAIFISTAAMFVAQMSLGSVSVGAIAVIWTLTSTVVLAIPHIPSASIVIAITVMSSAGVSTQGASLLYAVDWLLNYQNFIERDFTTDPSIRGGIEEPLIIDTAVLPT